MKDDLISRQAAIDVLRNRWLKTRNYEGIGEDIAEECEIYLKALPSAQPGCEDTVYRKAVQMLLAYFVPEERYAEAVDGLRGLPSVTPKAEQPEWIPCDRELPKPNEEDGNGFHKAYLVQNGRWMDVARWDGKHWIVWGYSTALLNVVAWCELPKPWEGGGDGQ